MRSLHVRLSVASLAVVMEGRTAAPFRCPCTDAWAPQRTSYWVELVGLPGFPALLEGRCGRCRDRWVALQTKKVGVYSVELWARTGIGVAPPAGEVTACWELEELTVGAVELTLRTLGLRPAPF